jgi:formate-dependent nitrite reductase membrane component NrfD
VGSWLLAAFTPAAGLAALLGDTDGAAGHLGDAAGLAAGALGLPLTGYTGVLIATTAIPAWSEARTSVPWLFVSSGGAAGAALLQLSDLETADHRALRRLAALAQVAELVAMHAVRADTAAVERVGRPYAEGLPAALLKVAETGTVAALALNLLGDRGRRVRVAAGIAGTIAALAYKFGVFHAGAPSARDPRATFALQRTERRNHGGG